MSNSYSNTPTRRIARLSLGPRSRYLKNRPIVSTDSISSAWISSIDTSSSATSSAVIYQGKKTFEWRDRVILKLGSKGGWPVDHYELERQEAEDLDYTEMNDEYQKNAILVLGYPYIGPVNEILTHQSSSSRPKILDIGTVS
ncbi:uncharacterized protein L201_005330 [Kwoniella dendrophila CBS 6074]|uniref:Uncharacterized protein n=1 Tax=Kwoniella dendrophila CBS 6074 TaxID=1295534 RepID=A0AAX4K0T5_9TREE